MFKRIGKIKKDTVAFGSIDITKITHIIVILFIIIATKMYIPILSYSFYIPPNADDVKIYCINKETTSEESIKEGYMIADNHDPRNRYIEEYIKINLYTTTITRKIECSQNITLIYRDYYLNISHVDIQKKIDDILLLYPLNQGFYAWYYKYHVHYLDKILVDDHGLSLEPIDNQKYMSFFLFIGVPIVYIITTLFIIVLYIIVINVSQSFYNLYYKGEDLQQENETV